MLEVGNTYWVNICDTLWVRSIYIGQGCPLWDDLLNLYWFKNKDSNVIHCERLDQILNEEDIINHSDYYHHTKWDSDLPPSPFII